MTFSKWLEVTVESIDMEKLQEYFVIFIIMEIPEAIKWKSWTFIKAPDRTQ